MAPDWESIARKRQPMAASNGVAVMGDFVLNKMQEYSGVLHAEGFIEKQLLLVQNSLPGLVRVRPAQRPRTAELVDIAKSMKAPLGPQKVLEFLHFRVVHEVLQT